MLNEPHPGYIGLPSLNGFDYNTDLHLSHVRESIALILQTITSMMIFSTYSICFPVIPTRNWTSNLRIYMDTFFPDAN